MNDNLMRVYSVVKYSDGSYALKDIENPTVSYLLGKKAITSLGKRYATGGRKLIKLKRICARCLDSDYCLRFYFDPETFDYCTEIVENISSEFENSLLYSVSKGEDIYYLDNGKRGLYHDITIGKDYMIDRRKGWGDWLRFLSPEDLKELEKVNEILREAFEKGAKVKFGLVQRIPKVKMIAA